MKDEYRDLRLNIRVSTYFYVSFGRKCFVHFVDQSTITMSGETGMVVLTSCPFGMKVSSRSRGQQDQRKVNIDAEFQPIEALF